MKSAFIFFFILLSCHCYSQDSTAVDSVKKILNKRYEDLAKAMDERNLDKIVSFRSADFHSIGPDGRVLDNMMMKEYSRQFITNNIPPYNIKNTIQSLRISDNRIVAVVEVFQEVIRKRDLAGKTRDVKTSVLQTETWIYSDNEWKLKLVDNVHNQKRYVDGKRVDPTKPYDPDAPEFNPGTN